MGFDYSFIIAKPLNSPLLTGDEEPDRKATKAVASILGKKCDDSIALSFGSGIVSSFLSIGVFGDTIVLGGDDDLTHSCLAGGEPPQVVRLLSRMVDNSEILAVRIFDVANLYGYSYFVDGELVRVRVGNDRTERLNAGKPLDEEVDLLKKHPRLARKDYAVGSEFAIAITSRFLVQPIDQFNSPSLIMVGCV